MPVAKLLNEKGIPFTASGKDYLIKCLNPEHEDNNPSCRVDRITGLTHCFSCGWKRNIFKHFGIFTDTTSVKVAKLKQKLKDITESNVDVEFPPGSTPYTESFRGISPQTFKKFEAFHTNHVEKLADRIIFPIRAVTGKVVAFIGRHVLSNANPRYVVYPSGKPLPCFPSEIPNSTKSIVLVEGIFDMLNLYDKGLTNAVCVFGTSTISSDNISTKMLPYKVQGISKVFIMFDADDPGQEAAKKLKPLLETEGFEVENIELQEGTDPGELDKDSVASIKEYIS